MGYLDPKYKKFNAAILPGVITDNSNFPFPFASKWNFRIAPTYSFELNGSGFITLNADMTRSSSYYTSEVPYPAARVRPLTLFNASIRFEDSSQRFSLTLYGQNITDKRWLAVTTTTPTPEGGSSLFLIGQDSKPAVYGARVGYKF